MLFPGNRTLSEWQQVGQDRKSLIADPLFVDPLNWDFDLRPESPALRLGFQPINTTSVGPSFPFPVKYVPKHLEFSVGKKTKTLKTTPV